MRRTAASAQLAVVLLAGAWTAEAQTTTSPPINVEASATVSGFAGTELVGFGTRLAVGRGSRSAFEIGVDWTDALHAEQWSDQIMWYYHWQMKHAVWRDSRTSVFATYGTSGWIQRQSVGPGQLQAAWVLPFLPIVGLSAHHVMASRVALRFDGQVLIWPFEGGTFFPRIGGGVTVPIRRYARP